MKPTDPRRIDPRVFAPNFAMRDTPPPHDTPNIEAPDPLAGDGPDDTGFSNIPDDPTPDLPPPSYGAPERFVDIPVEAKRRQQDGGGGGVIANGAFYRTYTDGSGHTWLQGGQVKSGSGNFTMADYKVIDGATGLSGIASNGDVLVVEATVDGYVADGVLLAGLTATASAYETPAATIDADTLPTASSHAGKKVHIEIGRWADGRFFASAPGNIRIAFCPGAYQITRY